LKVNSRLTGARQTRTNAGIVRSSPRARFPARRQREQDPQCARRRGALAELFGVNRLEDGTSFLREVLA
jgi:hypothetical protein